MFQFSGIILIFQCFVIGSIQQSFLPQVPSLEIPGIMDMATIEKLINEATVRISALLELDGIPEYARDDANDIIKDLVVDLTTCKDDSTSMKEFRRCVRRHVDDARDKIWTFDYDMEASSSNLLSLPKYLIFFAFLAIFHFKQRLSHALIASNTWK